MESEVLQKRMVREATLGLFVLAVLLGVLFFTIYMKVRVFWSVDNEDFLTTPVTVYQVENGNVLVPLRRPPLIPLPAIESNQMVDLGDMRPIAPERFAELTHRDLAQRDLAQRELALERSSSGEVAADTGATAAGAQALGEPTREPLRPEGFPLPGVAVAGTRVDPPSDPPRGSSPLDNAAQPIRVADGSASQRLRPWEVAPPSATQPQDGPRRPGADVERPGSLPQLPKAEWPTETPGVLPAQPNDPDREPRTPLPTMPEPNALGTLSEIPGRADRVVHVVDDAQPTPPSPTPPSAEDAAVPSLPKLESALTRAAQPLSIKQPIGPVIDQVTGPGVDPPASPGIEQAMAQRQPATSPTLLPERPTRAADAALPPPSSVFPSLPSPSLPSPSLPSPSGLPSTPPLPSPGLPRPAPGPAQPTTVSVTTALTPTPNTSATQAERRGIPTLAQSAEAADPVANQVESLGSPVESLGSPVEPLANPVDSPANVIEPSANQVPPSAKHVQPPANEGGAAAFSVEQLKQAMRRVRLPAGMSMVQLSDRLYGDSRYAMALLQLNHRRADDRGQFIPGTQIMYLPAEMLEYVYPDLIPAPSVEGDRSTSAIRPVDYREPLGERGSEADRREPPRRQSVQGGGTVTDWYVTRGGESLFQIAADSFDQASFYLQLWEWNRSQLEGRYRPTDPLPQGLRLRVAPPR